MAHPSQQSTFGRRKTPPRVTIARGGRVHTFTLRPWLVGTLSGTFLTFLVGFSLSGLYLAYRDDIMDAAIAKQVELQYAYEDRIAVLRSEIDRATSRSIVATQTIDEQVATLVERQDVIRRRQELLENLVAMAREEGLDIAAAPQEGEPETASHSLDEPAPEAMSAYDPLAYAPIGASHADVVTGSVIRAPKPSPAIEKTPAPLPAALPPAAAAPGPAKRPAPKGDVAPVLEELRSDLDRSERVQTAALATLQDGARRETRRLLAIARRLHLAVPARIHAAADQPQAVGGPFIPAEASHPGPASGFTDAVIAAGDDLAHLKRLRVATAAWPVRSPLPGARRTSRFGYRRDPFLGRPALHSGLDLKAAFGTPVKATATGTVVWAGWRGGYGRMVEVAHGNGLSTRYAHLSAISVAAGASVAAGQTVGALGSSGRSTGPHLHYETRVDGRAVDPARYIYALGAASR